MVHPNCSKEGDIPSDLDYPDSMFPKGPTPGPSPTTKVHPKYLNTIRDNPVTTATKITSFHPCCLPRATWLAQRTIPTPGPPSTSNYQGPLLNNCSMEETIPVTMTIHKSCFYQYQQPETTCPTTNFQLLKSSTNFQSPPEKLLTERQFQLPRGLASSHEGCQKPHGLTERPHLHTQGPPLTTP